MLIASQTTWQSVWPRRVSQCSSAGKLSRFRLFVFLENKNWQASRESSFCVCAFTTSPPVSLLPQIWLNLSEKVWDHPQVKRVARGLKLCMNHCVCATVVRAFACLWATKSFLVVPVRDESCPRWERPSKKHFLGLHKLAALRSGWELRSI